MRSFHIFAKWPLLGPFLMSNLFLVGFLILGRWIHYATWERFGISREYHTAIVFLFLIDECVDKYDNDLLFSENSMR